MKYLGVILLMALASPALAENWQYVTDGQDNSRYLIDLDTIKGDKIFFGAETGGTDGNGNPLDNVFFAIAQKQCLDQESGVLFATPMIKHKPVGKTKQLFWTSQGTQIYDQYGKYLCGIVKYARDHESDPKEDDKPDNGQPGTN